MVYLHLHRRDPVDTTTRSSNLQNGHGMTTQTRSKNQIEPSHTFLSSVHTDFRSEEATVAWSSFRKGHALLDVMSLEEESIEYHRDRKTTVVHWSAALADCIKVPKPRPLAMGPKHFRRLNWSYLLLGSLLLHQGECGGHQLGLRSRSVALLTSVPECCALCPLQVC